MNIDRIIDQIYELPAGSRAILTENIHEVLFPKGAIVLKAGRVEPNIYFIKKGIARAYSDIAGSEVTFWFGKEGDTLLSMKSYVLNQKGYEHIETLEACSLYELSVHRLRKLFDEDIHIANWARKFAEQELIKTEERLISMQFKTASERYKELIAKNPDLLQRVQLGHIASYLGITQVSLSRIRAEIR